MIKKGIVLERKKGEAVIMTSSGEVLKVRASMVPVIGQEYEGKVLTNYSWVRRTTVVAASFILVFFMGLMDYYMPVKAMELDMNAKLKLGVNRWNRVVKVEALDSKSKEFAEKVSIKNKTVNEAVEAIISEGKKENYIKDGDQIQVNVVKGKINENTLKSSAANLGIDVVSENADADKKNNKPSGDKGTEVEKEKENNNLGIGKDNQDNKSKQTQQEKENKKNTAPAVNNNQEDDEKKTNEQKQQEKTNEIDKENNNSDINSRGNVRSDKSTNRLEKNKEKQNKSNSKHD